MPPRETAQIRSQATDKIKKKELNDSLCNIGGGQPENLLDFVQTLQDELLRAGVLPQDYNFEVHKQLVPMQPGDVPVTYADATALERDFGFTPKVTLREGLRKFAEWYKEYYGTK
jgi:nucleoside-diphosphate-sugar epimerase